MTEQAVQPQDAPTTRRWGVRSISSLIIFVLATLLVVPALVGHWGHRTVIDAERYIETVGPLIDQPEVQQALAETITTRVIEQVDTESQIDTLLSNLFPDAGFTDQLAAPIASGINSLIGELVAKFVASDQFRTVWISLNTAAQKGVVLILEGRDGGVVSLQGDDLVLDTSAALTAIQSYLVDSGITAASNITIPDTDREVVLATAPGLAQIRLVYSLTSPLLQWFPIIIAIMFGAAILLARRRARTSVATGIVLLTSGVVLTLSVNAAQATFENKLAGTPWGPAADVFWATLFIYLVAGIEAITVLGVVVIVAGWFGGRTAIAVTLRGHVTRGLAELGSRLSNGRPGPLPQEMQPYARVLIYVLGGILLLFTSVLSVSSVLWISALVAGLITLAQLLAGGSEAASASTSSTPLVGSTTNE
jgi:hypothetical protein